MTGFDIGRQRAQNVTKYTTLGQDAYQSPLEDLGALIMQQANQRNAQNNYLFGGPGYLGAFGRQPTPAGGGGGGVIGDGPPILGHPPGGGGGGGGGGTGTGGGGGGGGPQIGPENGGGLPEEKPKTYDLPDGFQGTGGPPPTMDGASSPMGGGSSGGPSSGSGGDPGSLPVTKPVNAGGPGNAPIGPAPQLSPGGLPTEKTPAGGLGPDQTKSPSVGGVVGGGPVGGSVTQAAAPSGGGMASYIDEQMKQYQANGPMDPMTEARIRKSLADSYTAQGNLSAADQETNAVMKKIEDQYRASGGQNWYAPSAGAVAQALQFKTPDEVAAAFSKRISDAGSPYNAFVQSHDNGFQLANDLSRDAQGNPLQPRAQTAAAPPQTNQVAGGGSPVIGGQGTGGGAGTSGGTGPNDPPPGYTFQAGPSGGNKENYWINPATGKSWADEHPTQTYTPTGGGQTAQAPTQGPTVQGQGGTPPPGGPQTGGTSDYTSMGGWDPTTQNYVGYDPTTQNTHGWGPPPTGGINDHPGGMPTEDQWKTWVASLDSSTGQNEELKKFAQRWFEYYQQNPDQLEKAYSGQFNPTPQLAGVPMEARFSPIKQQGNTMNDPFSAPLTGAEQAPQGGIVGGWQQYGAGPTQQEQDIYGAYGALYDNYGDYDRATGDALGWQMGGADTGNEAALRSQYANIANNPMTQKDQDIQNALNWQASGARNAPEQSNYDFYGNTVADPMSQKDKDIQNSLNWMSSGAKNANEQGTYDQFGNWVANPASSKDKEIQGIYDWLQSGQATQGEKDLYQNYGSYGQGTGSAAEQGANAGYFSLADSKGYSPEEINAMAAAASDTARNRTEATKQAILNAQRRTGNTAGLYGAIGQADAAQTAAEAAAARQNVIDNATEAERRRESGYSGLTNTAGLANQRAQYGMTGQADQLQQFRSGQLAAANAGSAQQNDLFNRAYQALGQKTQLDAADRARAAQGLGMQLGQSNDLYSRQYGAAGQQQAMNQADRARSLQALGMQQNQSTDMFGRTQYGLNQQQGLESATRGRQMAAIPLSAGLYNDATNRRIGALGSMAGLNQAQRGYGAQALGAQQGLWNTGQSSYDNLLNMLGSIYKTPKEQYTEVGQTSGQGGLNFGGLL